MPTALPVRRPLLKDSMLARKPPGYPDSVHLRFALGGPTRVSGPAPRDMGKYPKTLRKNTRPGNHQGEGDDFDSAYITLGHATTLTGRGPAKRVKRIGFR